MLAGKLAAIKLLLGIGVSAIVAGEALVLGSMLAAAMPYVLTASCVA